MCRRGGSGPRRGRSSTRRAVPPSPPPGCLRRNKVVALRARWRWRGVIHRRVVADTSASPRRWCYEMPHTLAALECGALSEWRATLVVRESACLDVEDRRTLDAELCGDRSALDGMGDARVAAAAREIAYRLDAAGRRGPGVARRDRAHGHDPAGAGHHDVADGTASCRTGRVGVCGVAPHRRHLCRWPLSWPGNGRHAGRACHRATRRCACPDRRQLGDIGRGHVRREHRAGPHRRLRANSRGRCAADWWMQRLATSGRRPRCAGCTGGRRRERWWRWSRGPGAFLAGWPTSSVCGISAVARHIATRRSGTATTPSRTIEMDPPAPPMDLARVNAAITPRNHRAGK